MFDFDPGKIDSVRSRSVIREPEEQLFKRSGNRAGTQLCGAVGIIGNRVCRYHPAGIGDRKRDVHYVRRGPFQFQCQRVERVQRIHDIIAAATQPRELEDGTTVTRRVLATHDRQSLSTGERLLPPGATAITHRPSSPPIGSV